MSGVCVERVGSSILPLNDPLAGILGSSAY